MDTQERETNDGVEDCRDEKKREREKKKSRGMNRETFPTLGLT